MVEKFNASKTIVVVDYRGLTVAQATKLRKQLREAGVDYRVVKNTLLTIAAKEAGADALVPTFKGVTAIAFGGEDLIAPAQIIAKFSKENKILEIKGGLLEGDIWIRLALSLWANCRQKKFCWHRLLLASRLQSREWLMYWKKSANPKKLRKTVRIVS